MQNLFNRHKRKYEDGSGSEERNKKPKKHNGHHEEESRISKSMERTRLDPASKLNGSATPARSRKIADLIKALDEALEEDGLDETLNFIGDEAVNRCLDLRTSLSSVRSKVDASTVQPSSSLRELRSHDFFNLPKTVSPLSLTPWKSSTIPTTLPPLPKVLDPTLEASSFIHLGCGSGRPTDLSYERLEWVGDAYLELIATLLISQTFPSMGPGKSSQLRETLVKNVTLAQYSRDYGFDQRLRMPPPVPGHQEDKTKILGDIFEAYVAAVILSDPAEGVARASEWLKDLWGMTIAKQIIHEERNGLKLDSPLWRLRGTAEPVQDVMVPAEMLPLNPKEQLQKLLGTKGVKLLYKDAGPERKDPKTKLPVFTVGVYLDGLGEKDKMLGTGKSGGKKEAGFKAAEMAILNKKMMQVLIDKKKLIDAQLQLEKEAMESRGGS